VKAADQLLAGEKHGSTKQERVDLLKVVKRGGEILSKSNKGDSEVMGRLAELYEKKANGSITEAELAGI
jgi:hypothetical protein